MPTLRRERPAGLATPECFVVLRGPTTPAALMDPEPRETQSQRTNRWKWPRPKPTRGPQNCSTQRSIPRASQSPCQPFVPDPLNKLPAADVAVRMEGQEIVLAGTPSTDPDGSLSSYDWCVSTAAEDKVLLGA